MNGCKTQGEDTIFVLYHGELSTCSAKVRIALSDKGEEWEGRHLDLRAAEQHRPDYLALNPAGVVPTLVHDGEVVTESTVILEYLDDLLPNPALRPARALARARMRLWMKRLDEQVHAHTGVLSSAIAFRHQAGHGDQIDTMVNPAKRARKREAYELGVEAPLFRTALGGYEELLDDMDAAIAEEGWLAGNGYSLADISYAPYVARLEHLKLTPLIEERSALADWFRRINARESYQTGVIDWVPDHERELMAAKGAEAWPRIDEIRAAGNGARKATAS
jgi:glutathione S-transferase